MAASPSFSLLLYLLGAPLFSDEAPLCYFKNLFCPRAIRSPVPTSAVASSRPRVAGSRALTAVTSTAKPSSVLLANGRGWESGGGLFSVDFVGLCCKSKRSRRRLGVSCSRGLPRLLSAGKPAPPSSVKAVLHLERAGLSLSPAASRLVSPGTSFSGAGCTGVRDGPKDINGFSQQDGGSMRTSIPEGAQTGGSVDASRASLSAGLEPEHENHWSYDEEITPAGPSIPTSPHAEETCELLSETSIEVPNVNESCEIDGVATGSKNNANSILFSNPDTAGGAEDGENKIKS
ncbi:hypothetical protein NL676_006242 [Syzygium grande]|nr:hypothetical protein NL676_006242 [Syzygium grande]